MAVYSYTRVSTGRQAEEGESLGAQQRRVDGYAMMHGMIVDRHFIERGVSGSIPFGQRAQGSALLVTVRPGDVIITPKLDRCFRSALDALDVLQKLKDQGIGLHMIDLGGDVTGNGIAKLVFTILSAVAEAERDRIRERVSDVKRDQRQRGRFLGGTVPFGYDVAPDGSLVENVIQQVAIFDMVHMRKEGLSLRAIAERMNALGFKLSHNAVKEITERKNNQRLVNSNIK